MDSFFSHRRTTRLFFRFPGFRGVFFHFSVEVFRAFGSGFFFSVCFRRFLFSTGSVSGWFLRFVFVPTTPFAKGLVRWTSSIRLTIRLPKTISKPYSEYF